MASLLIAMMLIAAVVLVPLMLVGVVVKLAVFAVLLPFRILGALLRATGALVGGLAGLATAAVTVVVVGIALFVGLVLIPLLPFVLLGGFVWILLRAFRPRAAY
jgi:hypothetical protein